MQLKHNDKDLRRSFVVFSNNMLTLPLYITCTGFPSYPINPTCYYEKVRYCKNEDDNGIYWFVAINETGTKPCPETGTNPCPVGFAGII